MTATDPPPDALRAEAPPPEHPVHWPETPLAGIARRGADAFLTGLSWIWLVLLGVIVLNVMLRYVFGEGRVIFEEIQWHLYATGFLLGLGPALLDDAHVRVDLLLERARPRHRGWVEFWGILLLLAPFCLLVLAAAVPFVSYAWQTAEVSMAPGGLTMRWLIKAMLPLGFALLLLAALVRLRQAWQLISVVDPAAPDPAASFSTAPRPSGDTTAADRTDGEPR